MFLTKVWSGNTLAARVGSAFSWSEKFSVRIPIFSFLSCRIKKISYGRVKIKPFRSGTLIYGGSYVWLPRNGSGLSPSLIKKERKNYGRFGVWLSQEEI